MEGAENAEKINASVTVMYQNRSETTSLRIFLKDGYGIYLEIETLDEIKITRGLQCWLDKSTGNFRLQHSDEFSDMPVTVVFHFSCGFEPEQVRFEQIMYKHATFHEYHSRPSFHDHLPAGLHRPEPGATNEHIYEDLDELQSHIHKSKIEHDIKEVTRTLLKKVTGIMDPWIEKRKTTAPEAANEKRRSPQSLSRSSSCASSQPTPPGAIYNSDGEIITVLPTIPQSHGESSVNPGYVAPTTAPIKIYQTDGKSPDTFRREILTTDSRRSSGSHSTDSQNPRPSRRPTKKPPPPPTMPAPTTAKPISAREEIYGAANFLNSSPSISSPSNQPLSSKLPPPEPPVKTPPRTTSVVSTSAWPPAPVIPINNAAHISKPNYSTPRDWNAPSNSTPNNSTTNSSITNDSVPCNSTVINKTTNNLTAINSETIFNKKVEPATKLNYTTVNVQVRKVTPPKLPEKENQKSEFEKAFAKVKKPSEIHNSPKVCRPKTATPPSSRATNHSSKITQNSTTTNSWINKNVHSDRENTKSPPKWTDEEKTSKTVKDKMKAFETSKLTPTADKNNNSERKTSSEPLSVKERMAQLQKAAGTS